MTGLDAAIAHTVRTAVAAALADLPDRPQWDELLSSAAAADRLDVSRATVNRMIADGTLRFVKVGSRRKVRASDVQAFIESHTDAHRRLRGVA